MIIIQFRNDEFLPFEQEYYRDSQYMAAQDWYYKTKQVWRETRLVLENEADATDRVVLMETPG